MSQANTERPVGISILALFCILVAVLGLFAAGSYYLIGSVKGGTGFRVQPVASMSLLGCAYFLLARGLWGLKPWTRWYAPLLFLGLAGFALLDIMADEVLDLAAALLFLLAAAANMAVIAWLRQPGVNGLFQPRK